MKRSIGLKNNVLVRVITVFSIVFAVLILGLQFGPSQQSSRPEVSFRPHSAMADVSFFQGNASIADVAEQVTPGVVNISSTRRVKGQQSPLFNDPFFRQFFGNQQPPERLQRGLGSGVIVDKSGIVLTNNHVVAQADEIQVTISGHKREFKAKILGRDPKSDLAVLQLEGIKGITLKPLKFGDSSKMRLGDVVLAVGNPFGVGQTITMGIVSAKGRANVGIVEYEDFIQTDAAINPGNSGGALVNMSGELIGVNTAILSRSGGYQGIGFAIPTNMAKPIMQSLKVHGKVQRGWLGVVIQNVDDDLAKAMNLSTTEGVLISDIDPAGPAKKAGIARGDLVTSINGIKVTSTGKLRNVIAGIGAKGKARVEVLRDGKRKTLNIQLLELPERLGGTGVGDTNSKAPSGLSLAPLTGAIRQQLEIPTHLNFGILVDRVAPGSTAAQAGLTRGDVILEANRVKIKSQRRFSEVYAAAKSQVLLLVYRRGSTLFLILPKS